MHSKFLDMFALVFGQSIGKLGRLSARISREVGLLRNNNLRLSG